MKLLLSAAALLAAAVRAGNPVVPDMGMADPHVHYFNGSYYMYATHDFAPNNTGFLMKDWNVWESADLVTWARISILLPQNTPARPSDYDECWATDGATKDGYYYFYLSLGGDQVGVVRSSSGPGGPWTDVLHTPLINASVGPSLQPPTTSRDPCVFQDDDGSHYIIFGVFQYYIARLGEDMMSLAEPPQHVAVINPTGPYGNETDDKPFLHKRNGVYYLSWGCFYGTSSSPYGPYTYVGSVVSTDAIAPAFRMNQTNGPWYSHEDYADRHGSFWTSPAGQWYYACNDRSHSSDKAHPDVYRDTVLSYVSYYANGSIAPVIINEVGVGAYDGAAGWQAEHFFAVRGGAYQGHDEEAAGGSGVLGLHGCTPTAAVTYPHVRRIPIAAAAMTITASNGNTHGAVIRVLATAVGAQAAVPELLLCLAAVPPTSSWYDYTTVQCDFKQEVMDYLAGIDGAGSELELSLVLRFESAAPATAATSNMDLVHLDAMRITTAA